MWMPFLTQDINVHFRILFISKFELFKLYSKVHSFERMFEFNQVHLDPIKYILRIYVATLQYCLEIMVTIDGQQKLVKAQLKRFTCKSCITECHSIQY